MRNENALLRKDLSPAARWADDFFGRRFHDPEWVAARTLGASKLTKLVARTRVLVASWLIPSHWANEEVGR